MPYSAFIASTALMAKYEAPLPSSGLRILLSLIPVLLVIHSSLVSTMSANSALVKTYSGTYPPIAVIAAFILVFIQGAKIGGLILLNQCKKEKVAHTWATFL